MQQNISFNISIGACTDTDNGKMDKYGDNCHYYVRYPTESGRYDDDDFKAMEMCCTCKGTIIFICSSIL